MIELRWVERAHPPERDGATGYMERTLQYRRARWYVGVDGNLHIRYPFTDYGGKIELTEWVDVPTVKIDITVKESP